MLIKIPRGWELPERLATAEHLALGRRTFLATLGLSAAAGAFFSPSIWSATSPYPAKRNSAYQLDRPLTKEYFVSHYNNFAEFGDDKDIWKLMDRFRIEPWTLRVTGLVTRPQTFDVSKLIREMPLEERLYRHRCVEGWSMAIPWTGFPFKALIDRVQPASDARYVKMISFLRPEEAPNQKEHPEQTWPHYQGLTLDEAMHELTLLVTGMYGHELSKSCGAPIRAILPWKYGFKSLKSIVAIEFTAEQPQTFWTHIALPPSHFYANVNPNERYLNRSQAREKIIGTWETRPTLMYNGYGPYVAHLYEKQP